MQSNTPSSERVVASARRRSGASTRRQSWNCSSGCCGASLRSRAWVSWRRSMVCPAVIRPRRAARPAATRAPRRGRRAGADGRGRPRPGTGRGRRGPAGPARPGRGRATRRRGDALQQVGLQAGLGQCLTRRASQHEPVRTMRRRRLVDRARSDGSWISTSGKAASAASSEVAEWPAQLTRIPSRPSASVAAPGAPRWPVGSATRRAGRTRPSPAISCSMSSGGRIELVEGSRSSGPRSQRPTRPRRSAAPASPRSAARPSRRNARPGRGTAALPGRRERPRARSSTSTPAPMASAAVRSRGESGLTADTPPLPRR